VVVVVLIFLGRVFVASVRRRFVSSVAACVVGVLAVSGLQLVLAPYSGTSVAAAAAVAAPVGEGAMSQARALGVAVEDRSKWDATSRTSANPDGTWTTQVWSAPVNFRDSAGDWQAIDTTLVASAREGFAAETKAGPAIVLVPADAGSGPVRVEDQHGGWVSFKLSAAHGAPNVGPASATVADGPGPTQVRYDSMPWGVKESITIPSAPVVAPVYSFDVKAADGLTPALNADKEILFTDADDVTRFAMAAPFMQDASAETVGGAGSMSAAVAVDMVAVPGGWRLTMTPDLEWLQDPARAWPVVLDPTTTVGPPTKDTILAEDDDRGGVYGNATWLRVGSLSDSTASRRRSLVAFTMPNTIPTGANVSDASLSLYLVSARTTQSADYAVRAMLPAGDLNGTDWSEGNAKWSGSGTGTPWTGANTFFQGASQPNLTLTGAGTGTFKNWNVTAIVAGWVATPGDNNGFIVKPVTEPAPNELRFNSADATGNRPSLSLTWTTQPPTIVSGSLAVAPSVTSGGTKVARSTTPTLTATAKDPDSLTIDYDFTVLNSTGGVVASASGSKANPSPGSNVAFSYPVPAGKLVEGASYTAKFTVADETTTSGPLVQLPFRVDQAPQAPNQLQVDPMSQASPLTTPAVDPVLSAVVTDPGAAEPVTALFEVREQGTTQVLQSGSDQVDSGTRAAYVVSPDDPAALAPGHTYEFRVGSQDATDQGQAPQTTTWSGWVAVKVADDARVSVPLQLAEPTVVWDRTGPDLDRLPQRHDGFLRRSRRVPDLPQLHLPAKQRLHQPGLDLPAGQHSGA